MAWVQSSNIRLVGVIQLLFLIGHLYLIGVCLGEDQRTNTINTLVYSKRYWTTSSYFTNYSTLNSEHSEHDWEVLYV